MIGVFREKGREGGAARGGEGKREGRQRGREEGEEESNGIREIDYRKGVFRGKGRDRREGR